MTGIGQAPGLAGPAGFPSVRVPPVGEADVPPAGGFAEMTVRLAADAVRAVLLAGDCPLDEIGLLVVGLPFMPPRDAGVPGRALLDNALNHGLVKEVALANGLKAALPFGISDPAPADAGVDAALLLLGDEEQDDFSKAVVVAVEMSRDPEDLGRPLWSTATVVHRATAGAPRVDAPLQS